MNGKLLVLVFAVLLLLISTFAFNQPTNNILSSGLEAVQGHLDAFFVMGVKK